jgi:hypothetical protein
MDYIVLAGGVALVLLIARVADMLLKDARVQQLLNTQTLLAKQVTTWLYASALMTPEKIDEYKARAEGTGLTPQEVYLAELAQVWLKKRNINANVPDILLMAKQIRVQDSNFPDKIK